MKDWNECRLIFNSLDIHTLHKNTNIKRLAGKTQSSKTNTFYDSTSKNVLVNTAVGNTMFRTLLV